MNKIVIQETKHFILDRPFVLNIQTIIKQIVWRLFALKYRIILMISRPQRTMEKKHKVSICAIFKDEASILKEWIDYHLIVGAEHFYLYNNNSTDNFLTILKPYIRRGMVTLIDWPKQQAQIEAYEDAIDHYAQETKWMGFIDLDEFVVPCIHNSIYDFLKRFNRKASAVLIYWKVFGTAGNLKLNKDKFVIEQLTMSFPKLNNIGKCFLNTDFQYAKGNPKNLFMHHLLWCEWKGHLLPPVNIQNRIAFSSFHTLKSDNISIQINHYVTKSYEDYYYKTNIKSDVYFKNNPRSIDKLWDIDYKCTEADFKIFKYLSKLKVMSQQSIY